MSSLSQEEARQSFKTKLEGLLAEVSAARTSGDDAKLQDAMDALLSFNSPFDDLNQEAASILKAANTADLGQAVAEFSRIADRLGQQDGEVKSGLQKAMAAAQSGKKTLLIPQVAETTSRALSELEVLKSGIDTIVQQAGQVRDLQGISELLPQVVATLGQLKQAAGDVGIDIPDKLTNTLQDLSKVLAELESQKAGLDRLIQAAEKADDATAVVNLLPQAISELEKLKQAAKDIGIG